MAFPNQVPYNIEDEMTAYPVTVLPTTPIRDAAVLMEKHRFRHLPVADRGKVVGILSDRDLKQAILLADAMHVVVSDVMIPDPYCVKTGTPLLTVVNEMAKHKYGCTVILNNRDHVIGIFTTTDGMKILGEILGDEPPEHLKSLGVERFLDFSYLI